MRTLTKKRLLVGLAGLIAAAALIMVGRLSVDTSPAHQRATPADQSDEYFDGLQVGEVQGRKLGRALQVGAELPAHLRKPARAAFEAGYTAGTNDVFAGYDGGWSTGVPYIITLANGAGQVEYRIKTREPIKPNVNYYLCADGHTLCQQPR
jgi:hypothetical protein